MGIVDGGDGGSAITGHTLWLSTVNGFTPSGASLYGAAGNGTVITGLASNTTYYGILIATNAVGNSVNSAQASGATPATALPALSNLVARWSPDDTAKLNGGAAIADGDAIASFQDSVSGVTLLQATGANKPIYKTGGANGKPYLLMAAAKNMAVSANATLNTAMSDEIYTVLCFYRNITASQFSVVASSGTTAANNWFAGATTAGYTPAGTTSYSAGLNNQGNFRVPYNGCVGSSAVQSVGTVSGYNAGGAIGFFQHAYLNGCSVAVSGGKAAADNGTFSLGFTGGAFSMIGELYDVLIWDKALSPQEMLQAQKWACEKYNQTPTWQTYGKMYVAIGSSQASGTGATVPAYEGYVNKAARDAGIPIGAYTIAGYSSQNAPTLDGMAQQGLYGIPTLLGVPCNLSWLEYFNSRALADPAGAVLAALTGIKNAGFNKIGLLTLTDDGNGASWTTQRATFLSAVSSGYAAAGVSDLIRIDLDGVVGVSGVGLRGTAFTGSPDFIADLIHNTTSGYAKIAGYLTPILATW